MENSSMELVHGAAIYKKDNFSVDNIDNITSEQFLKLVLGPQRQDDKVCSDCLHQEMVMTVGCLLWCETVNLTMKI